MAASSGIIQSSSQNSNPSSGFSFSSSFMPSSFTDLLVSDDHPPSSSAASGGVPKFKSLPPPALPLSSPAFSPSSYFSIPAGLSPAELLDSPVLLSGSQILPSPTTGSFPIQGLNWMSNFQQGFKDEEKGSSDFTFQTQTRPPSSFQSNSQSQSNSIPLGQQVWNYQNRGQLTENADEKPELNSMRSFSPEIASVQTHSQSRGGFPQSSVRENKRSEDGYNWRKYGQKQVKGSENPRSYYKCTYQNCNMKKKVERSLEGQITEIVYKGNHNHPKPQSNRRSSSSSTAKATMASLGSSLAIQSQNTQSNEFPNHSYVSNGTGQVDSVATPENSSISDEFEQSSRRSRSGGDDFDEDASEAKRWKGENEGISVLGSRTVREPRVVVQTTSDIDILDDGYRWRKYGQKVVKGNPNPRSYYKCTHPGCPVRKHVERASHDIRAVITTYEGKHIHDVPAARGSNRSMISDANNSAAMAIRPPATSDKQYDYPIPIRGMRPSSSENQQPYTLQMLHNSGNFEFSGSSVTYMNQPHDDAFSRAKDEPRDDLFVESLLY